MSHCSPDFPMAQSISRNPFLSDFFPVILTFLRQLPFIGSLLSLPYIRDVSLSVSTLFKIIDRQFDSGGGSLSWLSNFCSIDHCHATSDVCLINKKCYTTFKRMDHHHSKPHVTFFAKVGKVQDQAFERAANKYTAKRLSRRYK
jgi:hypothetical protein